MRWGSRSRSSSTAHPPRSDLVKALCLGARAVLIGRAYLRGMVANGQAEVENVLDIMRMGMGVASVRDLTPDHLVVPDGFHRVLGATDQAPAAVSALAAQS